MFVRKISTLLWLGLLSSTVFAKSLSLVGELNALAPQITPTINNGDVVAKVKALDFSSTPINQGCNVTGDLVIAKAASQTTDKVCLFEYVGLSPLLTPEGLNLKGFFDTEGAAELNYQISFFSGSAKEKVTILTSKHDLTVLAPIEPNYVVAKTQWGSKTITGLTPTTYGRDQGWQRLQVFVEPRNYPQKITLDKQMLSCVVPEGAEECSITLPNILLGVGSDQLTGFEEENIIINSENDVFVPNANTKKLLVKNWDYRPPTIADIAYKAVADASVIKQLDADGNIITLDNNQLLVEVYSPHIYKTGDWWKPQEVKVTLTPENTTAKPSALEINGVTLFENKYLSNDTPITLTQTVYERKGDALVFSLDISSIPDGAYTPRVEVVDGMNNKNMADKDNVFFARTLPEIKIFHKLKEITPETEVFFTQDILVAGYNGYQNQVSVTEVLLNGSPVAFTGDKNEAQWLTAQTLPANTEIKLDVTVEDSAGNRVVATKILPYIPITFDESRFPDKAYSYIEDINAIITQKEGKRCTFGDSPSNAISSASLFDIGCYIDWKTLPEGTQSGFYNNKPLLFGTLAKTGEQPIEYDIYVYNKQGDRNLVKSTSLSITGLDIPKPEIKITNTKATADGIYPVGLKPGKFATARFESVKGDIDIYYRDENNEASDQRSIKQRRNSNKDIVSVLKMYSKGGALWTERSYEIGAAFTKAPSVKTVKTIKTVFVPTKAVKVFMNVDEKFGISTQKLNAQISVGAYDRKAREVKYDSSVMGNWFVKVVTEDADKNIIPLTDTLPIDANGKAAVEIDISSVSSKGANIYAIAELDSQLPNYNHTIKSQGRYYRVMKGDEVVGGLKYRTITAKPPFVANFRYIADTKEDNEVLGTVLWEVSDDDGLSWYPQGEASNKKSFSYRISKVGEWLVRAKATNRFTGVESITESVKVTSFNKPDIKIEGPSTLLTDQRVIYKVIDNNPSASISSITQWSTDEGKTWDYEGAEFELTAQDGSSVLYARMMYEDTGENAGKQGWSIAKHYIRTVPPKKLRLSARIPKLMEVGGSYTLEGNARKPYSNITQNIVYEWVLPDGSIMNSNAIDFTPTESDVVEKQVTFTLNAYLEGYKAQTLSSKTLKIKAWKYEFPVFNLAIREGVKYAPATIDAFIQSPRITAPGVTFSYEWIYDAANIENVYQRDKRAKFKVLEPGVHDLSVIIRDNRGNEQMLTAFVEALPLAPMEIKDNVLLSNRFNRYPIDVSIRLSTRLSHPQDRVAKYDWYLDGVLQHEADQGKYKQFFEGLTVGSHTLKAVITTEFGQQQEYVYNIDVVANKPPVCTASMNKLSTYTRVTTNCNDEDGNLTVYHWTIDGVEQSVWSRSISIGNSDKDLEVKVKAYDDSGDFAELTVIIPAS